MSEGEGVKRFLSGAESAKPESSEAEAWPMCSFSLEFTQLQSNWKIEIRDEFGFERQVLGCFLGQRWMPWWLPGPQLEHEAAGLVDLSQLAIA